MVLVKYQEISAIPTHFAVSQPQNIPNNAKLIEVASPALCAKWLFESQNDTGHVVTVPDGAKYPVSKSIKATEGDLSQKLQSRGISDNETIGPLIL